MDLSAIGFNYNLINGSSTIENIRKNAPSKKKSAEKDKLKIKGSNISVENQDKGRVLDISL